MSASVSTMAGSAPKDDPETTLFIGNFHSNLDEYKLLKIVQKFGKMTNFNYLYHQEGKNKNLPRGYAFVSYESKVDAQSALSALNGMEILGRKLAVRWSHLQNESSEQTKRDEFLSLNNSRKPGSKDHLTKMSTERKIAALEKRLKLLESNGNSDNVSFEPDVGGPSVPTYVTYNYVNSKNESIRSRGRGFHRGRRPDRPYQRRTR